jgi:hypothetical protein
VLDFLKVFLNGYYSDTLGFVMKKVCNLGALLSAICWLLLPQSLWMMKGTSNSAESSYYCFDLDSQTTRKMFEEYVELIKPKKICEGEVVYSRLISFEHVDKHSGWHKQYKVFLNAIPFPEHPSCRNFEEARSLLSGALLKMPTQLPFFHRQLHPPSLF